MTRKDDALRWAPEIGAIKLGMSELLVDLNEEGDTDVAPSVGEALAYLSYAEQSLRQLDASPQLREWRAS